MNASPLDDRSVVEAIAGVASLIKKNGGLRHLGLDDVIQELQIRVWREWPQYDAMRSHPQTFAAKVALNHGRSLIRRERAKKRGRSRTTESFDLRDRPSGDLPLPGRVAAQVDVAHAISKLRESDQHLARELMHKSVTEVADQSGRGRSAIYCALFRMRPVFEQLGLRPATMRIEREEKGAA